MAVGQRHVRRHHVEPLGLPGEALHLADLGLDLGRQLEGLRLERDGRLERERLAAEVLLGPGLGEHLRLHAWLRANRMKRRPRGDASDDGKQHGHDPDDRLVVHGATFAHRAPRP
jgi:hypothetical protein